MLNYINIFSQAVGINTTQPSSYTGLHVSERKDPTSTAAPDLYNGIIIQRYTEAERDSQLTPHLGTTQNSLMIYNTTEDCYNYWNNVENEWKSLCGALGKAVATINCSAVEVKGTYIEQKELNSTHYLVVPINVTKAGSYTITGTTTNGYQFYVTGVAMDTGTATVMVPAQGTPQAVQQDIVTLNFNGTDVDCTGNDVTVNVLTAAATYTISCGNATVIGIYRVGQTLVTTHYIDIPVKVTNAGSWSITSDIVDGISFSGSGEFTATGTSTVRIYGTGAPTSISTKTLTLTTNSDGGVSTTCTVDVRVTIPVKKILGIGSTGAWGYQVAAPTTAHARLMLDSKKNFGTDGTSAVSSDGYTYVSLGDAMSAATLNAQINSASPPDIIQIGYSVTIDASSAAVLADYAKKGGVVLVFTEVPLGIQNFMSSLMGASVTVGTVSGSGNRYALPNSTHAIVNGPFGNLAGLPWGDDGATTTYIQGLDATQVEVLSTGYELGRGSGNTSQITSFVHKKYNVVFIGDGGFIAGQVGTYGDTSTYPQTQPFTINNQTDAQPIPNTIYGPTTATNGQGTIYNSYLFGNIFAWAIYQAETNGYNKQN